MCRMIPDMILRPGLDICFDLCYFIGAHFRPFSYFVFRPGGASR